MRNAVQKEVRAERINTSVPHNHGKRRLRGRGPENRREETVGWRAVGDDPLKKHARSVAEGRHTRRGRKGIPNRPGREFTEETRVVLAPSPSRAMLAFVSVFRRLIRMGGAGIRRLEFLMVVPRRVPLGIRGNHRTQGEERRHHESDASAPGIHGWTVGSHWRTTCPLPQRVSTDVPHKNGAFCFKKRHGGLQTPFHWIPLGSTPLWIDPEPRVPTRGH